MFANVLMVIETLRPTNRLYYLWNHCIYLVCVDNFEQETYAYISFSAI
jgi:thiamine pyrophosphokinase